MKFDELLQQNPALRYLRSLDADTLRKLCRRLRGECTWCGQPVGKGRRTWCSDTCAKSFLHRCSPQHAATTVYERDSGICSLCRQHVKRQEAAFQERWQNDKPQLEALGLKPADLRKRKQDLMAEYGYARGQWYEIDHSTPVCEGGGLCEPSELRLLCGKCHKQETDKLAARIASNKKAKR